MSTANPPAEGKKIKFKAETNQLLDILIHSLYTEREVFLRELVSNASDALTRMNFELLTNREVVDPDKELGIWITSNPSEKTLTITDTGVGMDAAEMAENLGTIAHSGAREFLRAAEEAKGNVSDIIGQFGVGFYSAFMVAEWIRVTSRSYRPEAEAASWYSTGTDTFEIEPAEKPERGTTITIKLKEDAGEFAEENRIKAIIKKHSDYIPFPIYLGENKEQVNEQTALWRQQPRQVEEQKYFDFYKELTLNNEPPLAYAHLATDAPVQMYAVLFVPESPERTFFSPRKQDGLKLYARKVLIQEYCLDLLPEYFAFVEGVVDSEDLPLNVSRETVQSSRVMGQLKKLVTNKVIDTLKTLGKDKPEQYEKFWKSYSRFVKHGVASDFEYMESLLPLLRFHASSDLAKWISLDDYVAGMKEGQKKIYYILGEDDRSAARSPHLDQFHRSGYDVLLLTDPMDSFMLLRLNKYKDFDLANAANEKLEDTQKDEEKAEEKQEALPAEDVERLVQRFKQALGERVSGVSSTDLLNESPARLVDPQGAMSQEFQRVYKLLNKEYDAPAKELQINPRHPILKRLNALPDDSAVANLIIEQIYEDALLIEGLHPDPAGMIDRIQKLMEEALK